jgi:hypothetical protein
MAGLDTENTDTPYPIWGFRPPSPEPDTKSLDALLETLNGSARRFQTVWLWFLGLTFYLVITALGTTHSSLLLKGPQSAASLGDAAKELPYYLNTPLQYLNLQFFVFAPIIYVLFHLFLFSQWLPLVNTGCSLSNRAVSSVES